MQVTEGVKNVHYGIRDIGMKTKLKLKILEN